jgi:hypothetical protein
MARCVNSKCNKDPMKSTNAVLVSTDGDFACCEECKKEFLKEMDFMCKNVFPDPKKTEQYLLGKDFLV